MIRLFSKYRVIVLLTGDDYVIGVDRGVYRELVTEFERLNVKVVRINGFELANALRMRVKRRSLIRLPLLLIPIPLLIMASATHSSYFPYYTLFILLVTSQGGGS
ncbi:hypothetical protein [Vulcanisaeta sp. JCM 16161]|uniref:hypothetical protein n=1 Tax=Vulcanisaeta sp. JCM 16161 TaxID=1295372 RepID=UPI000A45547D|nr:hypothetical protein [Vulcanisaeta sp. JCM 16161]